MLGMKTKTNFTQENNTYIKKGPKTVNYKTDLRWHKKRSNNFHFTGNFQLKHHQCLYRQMSIKEPKTVNNYTT